MSRPLTLPPLEEATVAEQPRRYETDPAAESRRRYQMVWLAHLGQRVPQIAQAVLRSQDTVTRVLHRFLDGGLDAVPRRPAPGAAPTITSDWTAELLRVIDLDPHEVGVASATWSTGLLAAYLARQTGIAVSDETVRTTLHAHDYVCKRPTWTLRQRASEQAGYLGNA